MRLIKRLLITLVIVIILAIFAFVVWANTPPAPMPAAMQALQADALVAVETAPWITFVPNDVTATTGFIFYPGGRVDARSYAPPLRQIAEMGFLVVVVPMPLNLAFFGQENATAVLDAYGGQIEHWAIGGHSLGGAMAARYAHDHPEAIEGLVLWASFAEDAYSLADRDLLTAGIYGSLDGLASPADVERSRATLPANATFVEIVGGNHAQFGDYGDQAGDQPATISREEQQVQAVAATVALLEQLDTQP
jgi:hypothetical protein